MLFRRSVSHTSCFNWKVSIFKKQYVDISLPLSGLTGLHSVAEFLMQTSALNQLQEHRIHHSILPQISKQVFLSIYLGCDLPKALIFSHSFHAGALT